MLHSFGCGLDQLKPHLSPVQFKAGEVIKREGDAIESVVFPSQGLVSSRMALATGHEIECALIGATSAVGVVAALGFGHNSSARFVCLTDGEGWKINLPHLLSATERLPRLAQQVKFFSFAQMGYAVHVGVCNALHTAEQRLARWLATAADLLRSSEIRLPQEELASILGLQRSAVNPALQRLKGDGLIDVARGRIRILDPERIARRSCECRLTLRRALSLEPVELDA